MTPRKATREATRLLTELVPQAHEWRLHGITLHPVGTYGKWIYLVNYHSPVHGAAGFVGEFSIVVLMDGQVVRPEQQPWPYRPDREAGQQGAAVDEAGASD